ncbi:ABC transporter substrate-binding protein [Halobacteria archaeon AArc-curdl1]|uniref:ABC transporter substrate-binding protein n=1 Tax=Natronosalvus hydrolyticus TaxID=2979988 RepID=A0AAP2ZDW1_9EURY|nr:ABC transporter substrate-binding protein [Halobacteria archaeon AArc-curdl1]
MNDGEQFSSRIDVALKPLRPDIETMDRRTFVHALAGSTAVALPALSGCARREDDAEPEPPAADGDAEPDEPVEEGTLRIATTKPFVEGEASAAVWLKETFEERFDDAEIDWILPEAGMAHYVERERRDFLPDAEIYLGFTTTDLALADVELEDRTLFRSLNRDRIDTIGGIRDGLDLEDPADRILPISTQYVSLLVDETAVSPPPSLEALTESGYESAVVTTSPRYNPRGRGFLSWLIDDVGPDRYLEQWQALRENNLAVEQTWADALASYDGDGRAILPAFATDALDRIFEGNDPDRYRITYPGDVGYAEPRLVGIFEGAIQVDLAYEFVSFVLEPEVQTAIAPRVRQYPALPLEGLDVAPDDDEDTDGDDDDSTGSDDETEPTGDDTDDGSQTDDTSGDQTGDDSSDTDNNTDETDDGASDDTQDTDDDTVDVDDDTEDTDDDTEDTDEEEETDLERRQRVFAEYALEPADIVTLSYETRRDELPEWIEAWALEFDPGSL